ncbi:VOC family protein [Brevundimonas sp.]|jgi:catechol 2,3-dioxygenase-like lactoylglutathione lyase family enzyme|uniref:VOC family protein n=1 Tax=Brevundimonas sp. TaxID=1871086 RepID=UPI0028AC9F6C|nr:VOC family protein [Brevundimonas sp.]
MTPLDLNLTVLYVEDPVRSGAFYRDLLGVETVASSEGFTAVPLAGGRMLGLWRKTVVKPEPQAGVGGFEIGVMVPGDNGVADRYASLQGAGHDILQPLTTMDFGPTFVIRDPDGHRVRFCQPDA